MRLFKSEAIREMDRAAIHRAGIDSLRLMENAAEAIVGALLGSVPELLDAGIAVLCGKGNNGGDGMAVARLLRGMGYAPRVFLAAEPGTLSPDAAVQYKRLAPMGLEVESIQEGPGAWRPPEEGLVLDALFGTGLKGPLRGKGLEVVRAVNRGRGTVVAVDIPSGLSGDSPVPLGEAVRADWTLTLAAAKPCLVTPEGAPFCGRVRVLDIGIPAGILDEAEPEAEALDRRWAAPRFTPRNPTTHKGQAGRLLLVAGGRGTSGAAVLAARGALRAGAGLVTVATPASSQPVVAGAFPEVMTLPLAETAEGTLSMDALTPILTRAEEVDAVGLGPGLGTVEETAALCRLLYEKLPKPAVVDADALNAFDGHSGEIARHGAPRVLTPHPGEMGRLLEKPAREVLRTRYTAVPECAKRWKVALLLKGYRTILAAPGEPWRLVLSGGPHMAGAGFGDVLTGVIGALLARGVEAYDAASLGAWWHGAAADEAMEKVGGYGVLASEAADSLPAVEGALRTP